MIITENISVPEEFEEGKKIDLPIWLAESMTEFVWHEFPKEYAPRFQSILRADPEIVNLHRHEPKYFAKGLKVRFFYLEK